MAEWAHTSQGFGLLNPTELAEESPDGNEKQDMGLVFGDEVILYGRPDELFTLLARAAAVLAPLVTSQSGD